MSFTPQNKSSTAFGFLLQEISNYILQENGDRIILQEVQEWTSGAKTSSSFTSQSKNASSWTEQTKN